MLRQFIERGDAPRALAAEVELYNRFVKAIESEEHYERCSRHGATRCWASARVRAPARAARALRRGSCRVGFVFHTGSVSATPRSCCDCSRSAIARRSSRACTRSSGRTRRSSIAPRACEVPVEAYAGGGGGPQAWLRDPHGGQRRGHGGVGVGSAGRVVRVARARGPVQVFWSLKYHPIRAPEIDGYLTYGSWGERERVFHGQRWTVCPFPSPSTETACARRRRGAARQVSRSGSCWARSRARRRSRAPRSSRAWWRCFAAIRSRLRVDRARAPRRDRILLRLAGVADRCHFVGWVDTPLYAAILDVFLETSPLGCGITAYQALGAGVPLLSYADADTVFGMQYWSEVAARGLPPSRETSTATRARGARTRPNSRARLAPHRGRALSRALEGAREGLLRGRDPRHRALLAALLRLDRGDPPARRRERRRQDLCSAPAATRSESRRARGVQRSARSAPYEVVGVLDDIPGNLGRRCSVTRCWAPSPTRAGSPTAAS
jgi:hypothetical protein